MYTHLILHELLKTPPMKVVVDVHSEVVRVAVVGAPPIVKERFVPFPHHHPLVVRIIFGRLQKSTSVLIKVSLVLVVQIIFL